MSPAEKSETVLTLLVFVTPGAYLGLPSASGWKDRAGLLGPKNAAITGKISLCHSADSFELSMSILKGGFIGSGYGKRFNLTKPRSPHCATFLMKEIRQMKHIPRKGICNE